MRICEVIEMALRTEQRAPTAVSFGVRVVMAEVTATKRKSKGLNVSIVNLKTIKR